MRTFERAGEFPLQERQKIVSREKIARFQRAMKPEFAPLLPSFISQGEADAPHRRAFVRRRTSRHREPPSLPPSNFGGVEIADLQQAGEHGAELIRRFHPLEVRDRAPPLNVLGQDAMMSKGPPQSVEQLLKFGIPERLDDEEDRGPCLLYTSPSPQDS